MELKNCINYLLSVSQNSVFKYFCEELKVLDITPAQCGVLNCLFNFGKTTPKEIGKELFLEPSSISGILDRMQNSGLIERTIDLENRRNIIVTLTAKGNSLKPKLEKIILDMNNFFFDGFSSEEQKLLKKFFLSIIEKSLNK